MEARDAISIENDSCNDELILFCFFSIVYTGLYIDKNIGYFWCERNIVVNYYISSCAEWGWTSIIVPSIINGITDLFLMSEYIRDISCMFNLYDPDSDYVI